MALANFAAEPLRRLWDAFHAGDLDAERRIQLSLADINVAVTGKYGVSGLKYAMDRQASTVARPAVHCSPGRADGRAEIDRLLTRLGMVTG